jgi:hypothetical protein
MDQETIAAFFYHVGHSVSPDGLPYTLTFLPRSVTLYSTSTRTGRSTTNDGTGGDVPQERLDAVIRLIELYLRGAEENRAGENGKAEILEADVSVTPGPKREAFRGRGQEVDIVLEGLDSIPSGGS